MPSPALRTWRSDAARSLDEFQAACSEIGAKRRRTATQGINHAFVLALCSQFQRYCRDLHWQAASHLARHTCTDAIRATLLAAFTRGRQLDRGNATPGNLAGDFSILDRDLWARLFEASRQNVHRRRQLELLNRWRNAIAHHDFRSVEHRGRNILPLRQVRAWRVMCNALATDMDRVVTNHVATISSVIPW